MEIQPQQGISIQYQQQYVNNALEKGFEASYLDCQQPSTSSASYLQQDSQQQFHVIDNHQNLQQSNF